MHSSAARPSLTWSTQVSSLSTVSSAGGSPGPGSLSRAALASTVRYRSSHRLAQRPSSPVDPRATAARRCRGWPRSGRTRRFEAERARAAAASGRVPCASVGRERPRRRAWSWPLSRHGRGTPATPAAAIAPPTLLTLLEGSSSAVVRHPSRRRPSAPLPPGASTPYGGTREGARSDPREYEGAGACGRRPRVRPFARRSRQSHRPVVPGGAAPRPACPPRRAARRPSAR